MLLRNISPRGDLDIPLVRRVVAAGEVFDVTEDQARRLLEQVENFEPADANAGRFVPAPPTPPEPLVANAPEAVLSDPQPWKRAEPVMPAVLAHFGLDVEPANVEIGEPVTDQVIDEENHEGGEQL